MTSAFAEAVFQKTILFAQRNHLALGQGNRAATVRVRDFYLIKKFGLLNKKFRMAFQKLEYRFTRHAHSSISPVNTVTAGPVMMTG